MVRLLLLTAVLICGTLPAWAQPPQSRTQSLAQPLSPPRPPAIASGGVIRGTASTQNGTIPLAGVVVSLSASRTNQVLTAVSEGDGSYSFDGLDAGTYVVTATLDGFEAKTVTVTVQYNQVTDVSLDLPIAGLAERVDVVAPDTIVPSSGTITAGAAIGSRELDQLAPGGGFQAALRLLASVIEVPGGVAIKGGRPSQATVQLGPASFVDPSTGLSQVRLPDDAIESVTVLPNPYAVEYGRFSSGLVLIQTRRATDRWRTRVNNLDPTFRTRRGSAVHVTGIAGFSPRFETGGPLIKDRLYVQQAAQYRYRSSDVPSRPPNELRRAHGFSSFTRADATLSPAHSLVALAGVFPSFTKYSNLGTFTPLDATVDMRADVNTGAVTERALWSDTLFTETTVEVNHYRTDAEPQSGQPMQLLPENTRGSFFNRQVRSTTSYQLIETLSGTAQRGGLLHLFKGGIDVLHSRFSGRSSSQPVLIRRSDGTLVRRLEFGPASQQEQVSTDIALFVQDRVQPNGRWFVEFGARLDRDGVLGRLNATPRAGTAVLLNADGTSVVRGGLGLFYERTPSVAGAFTQFESFTDTRYRDTDPAPTGQSTAFVHTRAPDLHTSRSLTWDLSYDWRINDRWAVHLGTIDRIGRRELLVVPVIEGSSGELRLTSNGRSRYREAEAGVRFTVGTRVDLNLSYVRARAQASTNAFTTYFDAIRWPVVAENAYAPARADVPHRMLLRSRVLPTPTWLLVAILDWRSGLPYSAVNESLDFVGPRQGYRFPRYLRTELGIEHRIRLGKLRPWVGVRVDNALQAWLPADVQANVTSPLYGTFYNSEYRQFRIQFRFQR
ncbi:MAG: TonB-dependent receptor [Vicinamibacterales bacterium]